MKKAKIITGADGVKIVQRVYPNDKGKPFPPMHPDAAAKYIDVPDYVRPNMIWSEEEQKFIKRQKLPGPPPKRDVLIEILAEKLGLTYEQLLEEKRKRGARYTNL